MEKALSGFDIEQDVLIGGQSILFWCNRFDIKHDIKGALTSDIDVLGTQKSVYKIAANTGGIPSVLSGKTFGTNLIGRVRIPSDTDILIEIDVLSNVLGIKKKKVIEFANQVTIYDVTINVLNPLHCLHSKSHNFCKVIEKQEKYGFVQASLSTKIAHCYLSAVIDDGDWISAMQGIEYVHTLANHTIGKFCAKNGINVYDAIPVDSIHLIRNSNFSNIRLPRLIKSMSIYKKLVSPAKDIYVT